MNNTYQTILHKKQFKLLINFDVGLQMLVQIIVN